MPGKGWGAPPLRGGGGARVEPRSAVWVVFRLPLCETWTVVEVGGADRAGWVRAKQGLGVSFVDECGCLLVMAHLSRCCSSM